MNSANAQIVNEAVRLLENKIHRDFMELENLQSSKRSAGFANSTMEYINEKLYDFFVEKRPRYSLKIEDYEKDWTGNGECEIYVNGLCGFNNFLHGIPYFATVIIVKRNGEIMFGVVNNYATNEMFFVAPGRGAFLNNKRTRVSSREIEDDILVSVKYDYNGELFTKVTSRLRTFKVTNCYVLDFCHTACGKYDASIVFDGGEEELKLGALFITEAGGAFRNIEGSKNNVIFSNSLLIDDMKKVIKQNEQQNENE
ncbi:inositol monophosphatase [Bacilli bacterium]|nr:inositol monophosphatase [Bacilli bacterium]